MLLPDGVAIRPSVYVPFGSDEVAILVMGVWFIDVTPVMYGSKPADTGQKEPS
jgi:hypothetical protein